MSQSVSLLLGAGFSAPMGYPVGSELNELLLACTGDNFAFHTAGNMVVTIDGKKPNLGYQNGYDKAFEFCKLLIQHFNQIKGYFDYEEFYDFLKYEVKKDEIAKKIAEPFASLSLYNDLNIVYTHVISFYLKDRNGNRFYDNAFDIGSISHGYTGILKCVEILGNNKIVNVHTLNHDLFFESLNHSSWINGQLCDGFEELGSPYYGKLNFKNHIYHVRLERYTGNYFKKYRLFKLHGSRDYGLYANMGNDIAVPNEYVKTKSSIGFDEFLKEEVNSDGELEYANCWINFHADFLTGTSSKIERYKEPLLFKQLFQRFKENLNEAEKLIIIGYAGKDTEINNIIKSNYDYQNRPCCVIDPFPESVESFANSLNATIIKKHLEDVSPTDIGLSISSQVESGTGWEPDF